MSRNEKSISDETSLQLSKQGVRLWRNNVGALFDKHGTPVRYGLANISKAMNKKVKSADLIGIMPVKIEQHHVGSTLGVFMSIETKKEDWAFNPKNKRDVAQRAWADIVTNLGGYAQVITSYKQIKVW